jgi:hypothetical protein
MGASPSSGERLQVEGRRHHQERRSSRRSAGSRCTARARDRRSGCARETRRKSRSRCPLSAESPCSMRVRMPSVTTSMRVSRLTRVSSRVRKPTVPPTGSPSSCAMRPPRRAPRCGAARASGSFCRRATRRPAGQRHDGALAGARRSLQQHARVRCQRAATAPAAPRTDRQGIG